jgi:hypothetical protein
MIQNLLGPLITSKTRLKLLLRFFVNHDLEGYLQGLAKELDENSNSVRVELNRLEGAGLLNSSVKGRRKMYHVNSDHPLTTDISNIIRKVTGIDALVDRVVARMGKSLQQVWICGRLAKGIDSSTLEVLLVGKGMDMDYVAELISKVESTINKSIEYSIAPAASESQRESCLLVWDDGIYK